LQLVDYPLKYVDASRPAVYTMENPTKCTKHHLNVRKRHFAFRAPPPATVVLNNTVSNLNALAFEHFGHFGINNRNNYDSMKQYTGI
jgi:hypothetical protein